MSNRKLRTATADFLYLMARQGAKFFSARVEREMLVPLEKAGLVARGRTQASNPGGNWKGDRRRNTFWKITDKGWAVLRRRGSSCDQRMRVHQTSRDVPFNIDRWFNKVDRPMHEMIVETINFPEPGEIKLSGVPLTLMGARRRGNARKSLRRARMRARRAA